MFKVFGITYKKPLQPDTDFTFSHVLFILLESVPLLEVFHLVGCSLLCTCALIYPHYPIFQLLTCQYSTKLHIAQWSDFYTHRLAEY